MDENINIKTYVEKMLADSASEMCEKETQNERTNRHFKCLKCAYKHT